MAFFLANNDLWILADGDPLRRHFLSFFLFVVFFLWEVVGIYELKEILYSRTTKACFICSLSLCLIADFVSIVRLHGITNRVL